MRRSSRVALVAAVATAVAVELAAYDSVKDVPLVIADGVTGAVLLVSAIVLRDRRRDSLVGPLLAVAGLTWFAGTLWPGVRFLHRGALVHVHLSYPAGRIRTPIVAVTVAAVYLISIVEPLADNDALTLAVAAGIAVVAVIVFGRSSGTGRRAGIPALVAALALSGVLALGVANRLADWRAAGEALWAYNLVISGAVIALMIDLLRGRWAESVVAGLVVDLGRRADTSTLRGALARALGDPDLEVGYWIPAEHAYVDESGRRLELAQPGHDRMVTTLDDDGEPVAVLVHHVAVVDGGTLIGHVTAAARLAVVNARLQAASRERLDELMSSRRRIVEAADEQRRRLGLELREEVFSRIDRAESIVADARRGAHGEARGIVDDLAAELADSRADLEALSRGIHPLVLTEGGLAAALPALAGRAIFPVDLAVASTHLPPPIEAALYFVCAEALTNIAKHAHATRASIQTACADGMVTAIVTDNGRGGADEHLGTGLRGLIDRVEALGGGLAVDSKPGAGTTVTATIPIS